MSRQVQSFKSFGMPLQVVCVMKKEGEAGLVSLNAQAAFSYVDAKICKAFMFVCTRGCGQDVRCKRCV